MVRDPDPHDGFDTFRQAHSDEDQHREQQAGDPEQDGDGSGSQFERRSLAVPASSGDSMPGDHTQAPAPACLAGRQLSRPAIGALRSVGRAGSSRVPHHKTRRSKSLCHGCFSCFRRGSRIPDLSHWQKQPVSGSNKLALFKDLRRLSLGESARRCRKRRGNRRLPPRVGIGRAIWRRAAPFGAGWESAAPFGAGPRHLALARAIWGSHPRSREAGLPGGAALRVQVFRCKPQVMPLPIQG
jgi:hypothetical protein